MPVESQRICITANNQQIYSTTSQFIVEVLNNLLFSSLMYPTSVGFNSSRLSHTIIIMVGAVYRRGFRAGYKFLVKCVAGRTC
jgi:ABC-type enterochelin transport system permease subunit